MIWVPGEFGPRGGPLLVICGTYKTERLTYIGSGFHSIGGTPGRGTCSGPPIWGCLEYIDPNILIFLHFGSFVNQ